MRIAKTLLMLGLLAMAGAQADITPSKLTAKDFDRPELKGNDNGKLDHQEFVRFQLKTRNPSFNELDTNHDLEISEQEKTDWAQKWADDVGFPQRSEIEFTVAQARTGPRPKPKGFKIGDQSKGIGQLRLSKNHKGLLKTVTKSDPGAFGFINNRDTGTDTWTTQATIGLVRRISGSNQKDVQIAGYYLDEIRLVPSITINRVTGTGDGSLKEVDSLVGRGGLTFDLRNDTYSPVPGADNSDAPFWDHQRLSLNYRASTTSAMDEFKHAAELFWEPVRARCGDWLTVNTGYVPAFVDPCTTDNAIRPWLSYSFTFNGKLELGESIDETDGETFVKLGPQVGIALRPKAFNRFELFGEFTYLWEISDRSRDFEYFETGARYALDPAKQVFVELKYRNGQVPAKYTDIDLWQAALSVKF